MTSCTYNSWREGMRENIPSVISAIDPLTTLLLGDKAAGQTQIVTVCSHQDPCREPLHNTWTFTIKVKQIYIYLRKHLQRVDVTRDSPRDLWGANADDCLLRAGASWRTFIILFTFSCSTKTQKRKREQQQPPPSGRHVALSWIQTDDNDKRKTAWIAANSSFLSAWSTSVCSSDGNPDTDWYGCSCAPEDAAGFGVGRDQKRSQPESAHWASVVG